MIIKDNMANMCAKVTSTYMEFTLAFGPKLEFSFSFKSMYNNYAYLLHVILASQYMRTFVLFFDIIVIPY